MLTCKDFNWSYIKTSHIYEVMDDWEDKHITDEVWLFVEDYLGPQFGNIWRLSGSY